MKLKTAQVQDFKSVSDSELIDLDAPVVCLVGKNESGKTAVMEALYRLNPLPSGHEAGFEPMRDFPRQRVLREKKAITKSVPVRATFELDDGDVAAIERILGPKSVANRMVTFSRHYDDGDLYVNVKTDDAAVVAHLVQRAGLATEIASGVDSVASLRDKLAAIAEPTEGQQALATEIEDFDANAKARNIAARRIPKFLYFDEYDELPGRISVPYLQSAAEGDLTPGERTALSLLRLAGVEAEDFDESEYEARRAALEAAGAELTREVFQYWSQNTNLRIELDLDYKRPAEGPKYQPPFLEIRINNLRHFVTLNFGERSRGFQWFFSFLAAFSEYRDHDGQIVLLLDEPGLGLHAAAQADFLRYIEDDLATTHQVIYSTHSPFMVDATQLDRARLVEDKEDAGTKVTSEVMGVSKDTVFPLQAALGYSLSQTLFVGPDNLVVEGPSDFIYLTLVSDVLGDQGKAQIDPRWTIVPVGGLDNVPTFIALLGTNLNIAVLVDGARGGHQRIQNMIDRGIIDSTQILAINQITGAKEADIEDLFTQKTYIDLVNASGAAKFKATDLPKGNRIARRIEEHLGSRYDHYKPAAYLLRNQAEWIKKLDQPTLDNFEQLIIEINKRLS